MGWREADRRALQDLARTAREIAARSGLSPGVALELQGLADDLMPPVRPRPGRRAWRGRGPSSPGPPESREDRELGSW